MCGPSVRSRGPAATRAPPTSASRCAWPRSLRRTAPRPDAPDFERAGRRVLGLPGKSRLRRAADRLRGGPDASGCVGRDAARGRPVIEITPSGDRMAGGAGLGCRRLVLAKQVRQIAVHMIAVLPRVLAIGFNVLDPEGLVVVGRDLLCCLVLAFMSPCVKRFPRVEAYQPDLLSVVGRRRTWTR
jgi:hypothetical protein